MSISYVGRISPPNIPVPPEAALYWDYVGGNLYGSQPGSGAWALVGGNLIIPNIPIISQRLQALNTTVAQSLSLTPATTQMVQVSIYASAAGIASAGHEVVLTLNYTCELGPETITVNLPLDSRTIIMETYPLLVIGGTTVSLTTAYAGGATNDPYNIDCRLVEMP